VTEDEEQIAVGWQTLRTRKAQGAGLELPTMALGVQAPRGSLRLAIGGNGEPRLLMPLGMHDRIPRDVEGEVLEIREEHYSFEGRNVRFLVLECGDPELEQVFAGLVTEIGRRISQGAPAIDSLVGVVREFRHLLQAGARSVSRDRAVGLVGELLVLEDLIARNPAAVSAWQGPESARHDFRCGNRALEIKTTLRVGSEAVEISAIDQLFPPEGASLYLHHLMLEADAAGSLSVPRLAGRVEAHLADTADFRQKLTNVGFVSHQPGPWEEFRFSFRRSASYSVEPGFPRIGEDSLGGGPGLPAGVTAVRYAVDLSHAADFRLTEEQQEQLMETLAQCP
jgi:hypothetical protein